MKDVCSLCRSPEPQAGCPRCEERQPSLFSLPRPPLPDEPAIDMDTEVRKLRAERQQLAERLRFFEALGRPVVIGLVACSKQKREYETTARNLYTSTLFKASLEYAEAVSDWTFIVSAFHGLVLPGAFLRPYDRTLKEMPKKDRLAWGERVVDSLVLKLPGLPVRLLVLAGADYAHAIQAASFRRGWLIENPLYRLSIGERVAWLRARTSSCPSTAKKRSVFKNRRRL